MTQLEGHIMRGQETQLQFLIEQFPWILDKKYESYIPRRALKTICEEAQQQGIFTARPVHVASLLTILSLILCFCGLCRYSYLGC